MVQLGVPDSVRDGADRFHLRRLFRRSGDGDAAGTRLPAPRGGAPSLDAASDLRIRLGEVRRVARRCPGGDRGPRRLGHGFQPLPAGPGERRRLRTVPAAQLRDAGPRLPAAGDGLPGGGGPSAPAHRSFGLSLAQAELAHGRPRHQLLQHGADPLRSGLSRQPRDVRGGAPRHSPSGYGTHRAEALPHRLGAPLHADLPLLDELRHRGLRLDEQPLRHLGRGPRLDRGDGLPPDRRRDDVADELAAPDPPFLERHLGF